MATSKSLAELLQQAETLRTGIRTGEELPSVSRNLHQIAEAGQRLLDKISGVQAIDESTDAKASILLGSRGFDVPKLSQKLESLNAAKTLEPIEPVWETDVQGFLRNERENTLLAIIEESRKNTFAEAERQHWKNLEEEWETEKEKILNSLLGSSQEIEIPSESKLMQVNPLSMTSRSALDAAGIAYAKEVYIHNENKLQGLSHNLVVAFHEASKTFVDKSICDIWELLRQLVDVSRLPPKAYKHRQEPMLQKGFVRQARKYLEASYMKFVEDTVYNSLAQAQLGGKPGTLNLVKSFVHLRRLSGVPGLEDGTVEDQPVWALVFYCMRCGSMDYALDALEQAQSCADFAGYLREYIRSEDQRLSPSSEANLQVLYRRIKATSTDPFKRAVYCLLARCDIGDDHSDVCSKTDDYMWLKLSQVQFGESRAPSHSHMGGDKITLPELQAKLLESFGEVHFNAVQQPYLYVKVLLLTAQFEAAIEFLSRIELLNSHAVHIAIALQDMELLYLTDSVQSKLLVKDNKDKIFKINYLRLVMSYTKIFSLTDIREALEYFFLLKGMKGPQGRDLFCGCLGELVMESQEFELILGKMQANGTRKPGAVDKFQTDTSEVISSVAEGAEERGLYEDAVRLYDLAQTHNKVLELLNKQLSRVASSPSTGHSDRERLQALAVSIAERYKQLGHRARRQLSQTFFLLLDIMQFFNHYHNKQIDIALDVMSQLHLLPLEAGETVDQKVSAFRGYSDEVRRCLPDILLATMSILYTQYKQTSIATPRGMFGAPADGGQKARKSELRHKAKTLITFSGMIPYQMPGDTNARLVQMEVLMN